MESLAASAVLPSLSLAVSILLPNKNKIEFLKKRDMVIIQKKVEELELDDPIDGVKQNKRERGKQGNAKSIWPMSFFKIYLSLLKALSYSLAYSHHRCRRLMRIYSRCHHFKSHSLAVKVIIFGRRRVSGGVWLLACTVNSFLPSAVIDVLLLHPL
ncbi:hypothetical protein TNCT_629461 [Trichonephila clavata]|uniref:Uncharacterized protein n=1 Tax=Trichonephila clavata TaxID=2740835 RepID=A0A8X6GJJ8_TRICU|nr:hypothetical protein TNCT_629461 [Trichonephila clavata]